MASVVISRPDTEKASNSACLVTAITSDYDNSESVVEWWEWWG